jgi:hypothetical protein
VPGHHLQIALNREIEGLPNFRRFSYISAFGEGWGLYSEWLGLEAGFYTDPYDNFGPLSYEMWRACRLVVDTGIHAMGWTRQQAIDYLASRTCGPGCAQLNAALRRKPPLKIQRRFSECRSSVQGVRIGLASAAHASPLALSTDDP